MFTKIPCIIDTDPGVDDAFAILYAAKHPRLDLKAITTVFGNVSLEKTSRNALLLTGLIKKDVTVSIGHSKALVAHNNDASNTHGLDGFGGRYESYKHLEKNTFSQLNAVQTMVSVLKESNEKVVIFPIGPLTNIASLLLAYPELKDRIDCISLMGGAFKHGNRTSAAEFNFLMDPEAARIVFESGVKLVMAGLDITDQATISQEELLQIRNLKNVESEMLYEILDLYASHDRCLHDPLAIMAITDPQFIEFEELWVDIETGGQFSSGQSIADYRQRKDHFNVKVAIKLNHTLFIKRLIEILSSN